MKKSKRFIIFIIAYIVLIAALNILGRNKEFCDFYTDNIFRLWSGTYGRLTGLFSFSVGEVLIAAAVLVIAAAIVLAILMIFIKNSRFRVFTVKYLEYILVLILTVGLIMTLNCSIPYNCSKLEINGNGDKEYTYYELSILRNYIVVQCNELAQQMERDKNGNVIYDEDINSEVKEALAALSEDFPRMSGYFPDAKPMMGSYFMYQSGMLGVYFPFTMEANYNKYISPLWAPYTIAHELSHLKGYMYEDEANFMAYLACVGSDSRILQYSAYINVLDYVDNDYLNYINGELPQDYIEISQLVYHDNWCYTDETVDELDSHEQIISSEVMSDISDDFEDAYLNYYDAKPNYYEVTRLLLQYYDGILY